MLKVGIARGTIACLEADACQAFSLALSENQVLLVEMKHPHWTHLVAPLDADLGLLVVVPVQEHVELPIFAISFDRVDVLHGVLPAVTFRDPISPLLGFLVFVFVFRSC